MAVKKDTFFGEYNQSIKVNQFTLIDEAGNNLGVVSKDEAIRMAQEKELDVVLVSNSGESAVAKIVDWAKYKYEKTKKQRKNKGKSVETKEWWFKPTIGDRDLTIRLKKIKAFLKKGGNAKIVVKPDKKVPYEIINEAMKKISTQIEEFAKPISDVSREGRNLSILIKLK
jgi:translation initiation factor IF-3